MANLYKHQPQDSVQLSAEESLSVADSLRRRTFRQMTEIPSYEQIQKALRAFRSKVYRSDNHADAVRSAHIRAAREISNFLNSNGYEVLFVTAYGSYARNDPVSTAEDVDLNVFVRELPQDRSQRLNLYEDLGSLTNEVLYEVTGGIPNDTHPPNLFDLEDLRGFAAYATAVHEIGRYKGSGDRAILKGLAEELDRYGLSRSKQNAVMRAAEGKARAVDLYPKLTSADMPYQFITYNHTLENFAGDAYAQFSQALDTIMRHDPIFRHDFAQWLCGEAEWALSRHARDKNYDPDVNNHSHDDYVRHGKEGYNINDLPDLLDICYD